MSQADDTRTVGRGLSRRSFLRSGSAALGSLVVIGPLSGFDACRGPRPQDGYGPLAPVADLTTGLPLLKLPPGSRTSRSAGRAT